jgi:hypothetical protein
MEYDTMSDERESEGAEEPRLIKELRQLREKVRAGTHSGESFELMVTDEELDETLDWYAGRQSSAPFQEVRVSIFPEGIGLSGEASLGGLRARISGRVDIYLEDGVPRVAFGEMKMGEAGLPDFILFQLEDQLNRQLILGEDQLPLIIEELELEEGSLIVRGTLR